MTAAEFYTWTPPTDDERSDGPLWELVDGVPVSRLGLTGERHGSVCGFIGFVLWQHVSATGRGYALSNNVGFLLGRDPDTVLCPDLVAYARSKRLRDMGDGPVTDVPGLVIEVTDPSDAGFDYADRAERWLTMGVPTVWTVDSDRLTVDVYRLGRGVEVVAGGETLPADGLPGFACRAEELFRRPRVAGA